MHEADFNELLASVREAGEMMHNPHIGSSLDEWLAETFTSDEVQAIDTTARKRVQSWKERHIEKMRTDPKYRKHYEMEDRMMRRKVRKLARLRLQRSR